ncbi:MAG: hypothetical protein RR478_04380 [Bacilli bacterium]
MEKVNRFPIGFFEKVRPKVTPSTNPDDEIIPIKWSKKILTRNHKDKILIKSANDKGFIKPHIEAFNKNSVELEKHKGKTNYFCN